MNYVTYKYLFSPTTHQKFQLQPLRFHKFQKLNKNLPIHDPSIFIFLRFSMCWKITKKQIPNDSPFSSPSYPWRFLPTELHISQQRRRAQTRRRRHAAPQRCRGRGLGRGRVLGRQEVTETDLTIDGSRDQRIHQPKMEKKALKSVMSVDFSSKNGKIHESLPGMDSSVSVATSCEERESLRISFEHIWNTSRRSDHPNIPSILLEICRTKHRTIKTQLWWNQQNSLLLLPFDFFAQPLKTRVYAIEIGFITSLADPSNTWLHAT